MKHEDSMNMAKKRIGETKCEEKAFIKSRRDGIMVENENKINS